jgi:hypothetical protein
MDYQWMCQLCVKCCMWVRYYTTFRRSEVLRSYMMDSGPGSIVGIATGYGLDGPGIESWWGHDFLHLSRLALGPTQPPVQWVPGLSRGVKGSRGMTLTPHPPLVLWSWMGRAIPLLSLWAIWPVQSLSPCRRVRFTLTLWQINVTKTNQLRHIQQNSFNPPSTNLEILKIWHWRYFLDWKFWFCQKKRFVIETNISKGHISKGLQECMYIRHCGFSFLLHQLLLLWRPWWPRTSRWRRYPNGIVPWLVIVIG